MAVKLYKTKVIVSDGVRNKTGDIATLNIQSAIKYNIPNLNWPHIVKYQIATKIDLSQFWPSVGYD